MTFSRHCLCRMQPPGLQRLTVQFYPDVSEEHIVTIFGWGRGSAFLLLQLLSCLPFSLALKTGQYVPPKRLALSEIHDCTIQKTAYSTNLLFRYFWNKNLALLAQDSSLLSPVHVLNFSRFGHQLSSRWQVFWDLPVVMNYILGGLQQSSNKYASLTRFWLLTIGS
jgi:hypothetical protein